ncbi:MAG TPA: hypothetical protein DCS30_14215 [Rhizobiales bacterium]|nr:hypothetical protein [Hyphomicrobiales bacterium]
MKKNIVLSFPADHLMIQNPYFWIKLSTPARASAPLFKHLARNDRDHVLLSAISMKFMRLNSQTMHEISILP